MSERSPQAANWDAPNTNDYRHGPIFLGEQSDLSKKEVAEVEPFDISDIVGLDSNASEEETRRVIAERMNENEGSNNPESLNEWQQMTDQELRLRFDGLQEAIKELNDNSSDRIQKNVKKAEIKAIEEELANRGLSLDDIIVDQGTSTGRTDEATK